METSRRRRLRPPCRQQRSALVHTTTTTAPVVRLPATTQLDAPACERDDMAFMFVSPFVRRAWPSTRMVATSSAERTRRVTAPSRKMTPPAVCRMRGPSSSPLDAPASLAEGARAERLLADAGAAAGDEPRALLPPESSSPVKAAAAVDGLRRAGGRGGGEAGERWGSVLRVRGGESGGPGWRSQPARHDTCRCVEAPRTSRSNKRRAKESPRWSPHSAPRCRSAAGRREARRLAPRRALHCATPTNEYETRVANKRIRNARKDANKRIRNARKTHVPRSRSYIFSL